MRVEIIVNRVSKVSSVQFSHSVLSDSLPPMSHNTPGLSVHHQLPEFTQTHVHRVSDAIQPSISSFVVPFSSCPQCLPASKSLHRNLLKMMQATRMTFEVSSVQFSSVAQSCLTLCNLMNRSTPGLPVHHHVPEFTQTHVHRVSDATHISFSVNPFSCPHFLPASGSFPMSQFFTSGGQSIGASASASVLPVNTQD